MIPEVVNQIAFEVIGNDITVSFAAEAGQLQLNAFEPIIAHSLFKSITHLRNGCLHARRALRERYHREPRAAAATSWRTRSASSPRSIRTSATRTRREIAQEALASGRAASTISCSSASSCRRSGSTRSCSPEVLTHPRPILQVRARLGLTCTGIRNPGQRCARCGDSVTHRVVIVGGGAGGLELATRLGDRSAPQAGATSR